MTRYMAVVWGKSDEHCVVQCPILRSFPLHYSNVMTSKWNLFGHIPEIIIAITIILNNIYEWRTFSIIISRIFLILSIMIERDLKWFNIHFILIFCFLVPSSSLVLQRISQTSCRFVLLAHRDSQGISCRLKGQRKDDVPYPFLSWVG